MCMAGRTMEYPRGLQQCLGGLMIASALMDEEYQRLLMEEIDTYGGR